jgi:UDP-N-acetylmuramate dehydrogenase
VLEATLLNPDGSIERVGPDALGFRYRNTDLKGGDALLLDVLLRAEPGDTTAAAAEREEHLADRRRKHPVDEPCAGSYFQNLPPARPGERRRAAGALLDRLGARGWREGGAAVYEKHANIIVNLGGATCRDVLTLAARMKAAVLKEFGEELVEEVRHLPRHKTVGGFSG